MLPRILKYKLIALAIAATVAGCKDPDLVGIDALPNTDGFPVNVVDTFTLVAKTELVDSLTTSNFNSGNWLVGSFYDPVFGISASTLYTQYHLPSSNVSFGSGATIDSVVMYLSYAGSYGNWDRLRGFQKLDVYKLGEGVTLRDSTTYRSHTTRVLGEWQTSTYFRPDLFNPVVVPGGTGEASDTTLSALRIKLPNQFGTDILTAGAGLTSNTEFLKDGRFKGLALVPDVSVLGPEEGTILYMNMYSPNSRIRLYYHTQPDTIQTFDLIFGKEAATHTYFYHDYSSTTLINDTGSTVAGDQQLYVQSMSGMAAEVDFSTLRNLTEGRNIAINKAELIIPIESFNFSDYAPPPELFLTTIDTNGVDHFPVDLVIGQGGDYYGGQINFANLEYVFNLGGHVQRILTDPFYTSKIELSVSGGAVNGYRGILNGPGHATRPMKLRITYTEIQP